MENEHAVRQPCPQLWSFCMVWRVPAREWPAFTQTVRRQLISLTMSDGVGVFSQIVQIESRVGCVPTPWTPSQNSYKLCYQYVKSSCLQHLSPWVADLADTKSLTLQRNTWPLFFTDLRTKAVKYSHRTVTFATS